MGTPEIPFILGRSMGIMDRSLSLRYLCFMLTPIFFSLRIQKSTWPLRIASLQGYLLSPLLFNIVLEFQARAIRQEEEIKGIQTGKEVLKISLLADDMILKTWKNPPQNSYYHKQLQQSNRIQNQLTKVSSLLYTNNKQIEKEYRKSIPFNNSLKNNQIPRNELNKGCKWHQ
jgi:hypothetical protein